MEKFIHSIDINRPIQKIADLFSDPDNMSKWQPEFVAMEHVSGTPGKAGNQNTLIYQIGRRKMKMKETILKNDLPYQFDARYEMKGIFNEVHNSFEEVNPNLTRWTSETSFRFKGIMWLIGRFMRGNLEQQSRMVMENFKRFAEQS